MRGIYNWVGRREAFPRRDYRHFPGRENVAYELCRKVKPQATLEIGLAYGFSTIYFLAVLAENGNGHHSSIDPYQRCLPGDGRESD